MRLVFNSWNRFLNDILAEAEQAKQEDKPKQSAEGLLHGDFDNVINKLINRFKIREKLKLYVTEDYEDPKLGNNTVFEGGNDYYATKLGRNKWKLEVIELGSIKKKYAKDNYKAVFAKKSRKGRSAVILSTKQIKEKLTREVIDVLDLNKSKYIAAGGKVTLRKFVEKVAKPRPETKSSGMGSQMPDYSPGGDDPMARAKKAVTQWEREKAEGEKKYIRPMTAADRAKLRRSGGGRTVKQAVADLAKLASPDSVDRLIQQSVLNPNATMKRLNKDYNKKIKELERQFKGGKISKDDFKAAIKAQRDAYREEKKTMAARPSHERFVVKAEKIAKYLLNIDPKRAKSYLTMMKAFKRNTTMAIKTAQSQGTGSGRIQRPGQHPADDGSLDIASAQRFVAVEKIKDMINRVEKKFGGKINDIIRQEEQAEKYAAADAKMPSSKRASAKLKKPDPKQLRNLVLSDAASRNAINALVTKQKEGLELTFSDIMKKVMGAYQKGIYNVDPTFKTKGIEAWIQLPRAKRKVDREPLMALLQQYKVLKKEPHAPESRAYEEKTKAYYKEVSRLKDLLDKGQINDKQYTTKLQKARGAAGR